MFDFLTAKARASIRGTILTLGVMLAMAGCKGQARWVYEPMGSGKFLVTDTKTGVAWIVDQDGKTHSLTPSGEKSPPQNPPTEARTEQGEKK